MVLHHHSKHRPSTKATPACGWLPMLLVVQGTNTQPVGRLFTPPASLSAHTGARHTCVPRVLITAPTASLHTRRPPPRLPLLQHSTARAVATRAAAPPHSSSSSKLSPSPHRGPSISLKSIQSCCTAVQQGTGKGLPPALGPKAIQQLSVANTYCSYKEEQARGATGLATTSSTNEQLVTPLH